MTSITAASCPQSNATTVQDPSNDQDHVEGKARSERNAAAYLEVPHLGHSDPDQNQDLPYAPPDRSSIDPLARVPESRLDLSLVLLFPTDGRDSVIQILQLGSERLDVARVVPMRPHRLSSTQSCDCNKS